MSKNSEEFSFEKKKKLAERISKLSNKSEILKIKSIIEECNPDLIFSKNSSGFLTKFQDLEQSTYEKLTKYVNSIEKKKLKKLELESEVLRSEIVSEDIKNVSNEKINKKLRLTNTESHILNRAKYEKELIKNEKESKGEFTGDITDDIFVQNKPRIRKPRSKK